MIKKFHDAENNSQQQYTYIYLLRIVGALLVSWGHLVTGAALSSTVLSDAGIDSSLSPLLSPEEYFLWKPDMWLIIHHGIPMAWIGVTIFFLVSGFLVPRMQEKYNKDGESLYLLQSRLAKLFPHMLVNSIIIGLVCYFSQHVTFPLASYISSITLSSNWTGIPTINGIMWYILVLVLYYFIATLVPQFTLKNLTFVYLGLYLFIGVSSLFQDQPFFDFLCRIIYSAKFCGLLLLGTGAFLLRKKSWGGKTVGFFWFYTLTIKLFVFESCLYGTETSFTNPKNYYVSFFIIALVYLLTKIFDVDKALSLLKKIDEILLPFYLLHFCCGYTVIYWLSRYNINSYFCLLAAYIVSICMAKIAAIAVKPIAKVVKCAHKLDNLGRQKDQTYEEL